MKIEILSIKENEDGSADIEFDLDKEYKDQIKKIIGVKKLTKKRFEKFVLDALTKQLKKYEDL